ncbi:type II secretion system protein [Marivivens marinus]
MTFGNPRSGVTLLEFLVALAIIAMITAFGGYAHGDFCSMECWK